MGKQEKLTGRERAARYRASMRAKGFRLKQFWVPDVRTPEFKAEARRQSLLVANSPHEAEHQAWVDSVTDWESLPPYDAPLADRD
jgi:DNA-binding LacI/PurR family transcriptional regulator